MNQELNERLNFDYTKTLFEQVFNTTWTFNEYVTFINEPKHLINPIRDITIFENRFLEAISKCTSFEQMMSFIPHWIWNIWGIYTFNQGYSPLYLVGMFFIAALSWTFMEYTLHRFLFHCEDYWLYYMPWNKYTHSVHFFTHGIHHAFP